MCREQGFWDVFVSDVINERSLTSSRINISPEVSVTKRVDIGGVPGKVFIQDSRCRRVEEPATFIRQFGNLSLQK